MLKSIALIKTNSYKYILIYKKLWKTFLIGDSNPSHSRQLTTFFHFLLNLIIFFRSELQAVTYTV